MGYFLVRYDSRVVIYDHRMFIRLTTGSRVVIYDHKVFIRLTTEFL